MTKIHIEIDEVGLRCLIQQHIADLIGAVSVKPEDITIEVKSEQNYKAEWEPASFRATVQTTTK